MQSFREWNAHLGCCARAILVLTGLCQEVRAEQLLLSEQLLTAVIISTDAASEKRLSPATDSGI